MAYAVKRKEDEQQPGMSAFGQQVPPSTAPGTPIQPQSISGSQTSAISGTPQQQTQQLPAPSGQSNQPARSGLATNVQKYISGNKEAAGKMAEAGVKQFAGQTGQVSQAIQSQKEQFQNALEQNKARMSAAGEFAKQTVEKAGSATPELVQAQDIERFQNITGGKERFDQAALNLSPEFQKSSQISNLAKDIERADIRRELLRQTAGGRGYTAGKGALDELIMSGSQGAQERLKQGVQGQSQALADQLRRERVAGNIASGEIAGAGTKLVEDINAARTAKEQGLGTELSERLSGAELERQATLDLLKEQAQAGQFSATEEQLKQLGLTPGSYLYGVNLADYLKGGEAYTTENIASQQDLARARALAQLGGKTQTLLADESVVGNRPEMFSPTNQMVGDIGAAKAAADAQIAQMEAENAAEARNFGWGHFAGLGGTEGITRLAKLRSQGRNINVWGGETDEFGNRKYVDPLRMIHQSEIDRAIATEARKKDLAENVTLNRLRTGTTNIIPQEDFNTKLQQRIAALKAAKLAGNTPA